MIKKDGIVYFTEDELKCKGTGKLILAEGFADKLLELRLKFLRPMQPISCCRAESHNAKVSTAKNSLHICDTGRGCCAIDIATPDTLYRTELVKLALELGWSVGIKHTMVHLDRRVDYSATDPQVLFLY